MNIYQRGCKIFALKVRAWKHSFRTFLPDILSGHSIRTSLQETHSRHSFNTFYQDIPPRHSFQTFFQVIPSGNSFRTFIQDISSGHSLSRGNKSWNNKNLTLIMTLKNFNIFNSLFSFFNACEKGFLLFPFDLMTFIDYCFQEIFCFLFLREQQALLHTPPPIDFIFEGLSFIYFLSQRK